MNKQTAGSLIGRTPMKILRQMWKPRRTEGHFGRYSEMLQK